MYLPPRDPLKVNQTDYGSCGGVAFVTLIALVIGADISDPLAKAFGLTVPVAFILGVILAYVGILLLPLIAMLVVMLVVGILKL